MSNTVTVEEASAKLAELIDHLAPGEEVVITRNNRPIARLVPSAETKPSPQFGSCKGMITIISDDDDHLEDFTEYMS